MVNFDLFKRIITALVLLPMVIFLIFTGSYLFFVSILLLGAFSSYEMSRLVRLWGYHISTKFSVISCLLLTSVIYINLSFFNENIFLLI